MCFTTRAAALLVGAVTLVCPLLLTGLAAADATPVGALPAGPASTITAKRGTLVAIALPAQKASSGLTWRLARTIDVRVLRETVEADVDGSVVVVFHAAGAGTTRVVYALTRGDASPRALAVRVYRVRVDG